MQKKRSDGCAYLIMLKITTFFRRNNNDMENKSTMPHRNCQLTHIEL